MGFVGGSVADERLNDHLGHGGVAVVKVSQEDTAVDKHQHRGLNGVQSPSIRIAIVIPLLYKYNESFGRDKKWGCCTCQVFWGLQMSSIEGWQMSNKRQISILTLCECQIKSNFNSKRFHGHYTIRTDLVILHSVLQLRLYCNY